MAAIGWENGNSSQLTDDISAAGSSPGAGEQIKQEDDPWDQAIARLQMEERNRARQGTIVNDRYRICSKIGVGSFGFVHAGIDIVTNEILAIKMELRSENKEHTKLPTEHLIYDLLTGLTGVPKVYWYEESVCGGRYRAMGMQLLGPNMNDLFDVCNHYFSLRTTVGIGLQMLDRIQQLHSIGYVHRDIKPDNFLVPLESSGPCTISLVDFGMAKSYLDKDAVNGDTHVENKARMPGRNGAPQKGTIIGTAPYASLNSHNGWTLGRRDDIESLAYMLIYFTKGTLPWKEIRFRNHQHKQNLIRKLKSQTSPRDICCGIPWQFEKFLITARGLSFNEEPPYAKFKDLLWDIAQKRNLRIDGVYDWHQLLKKNEKLREHWKFRFRWTLDRNTPDAHRFWEEE